MLQNPNPGKMIAPLYGALITRKLLIPGSCNITLGAYFLDFVI